MLVLIAEYRICLPLSRQRLIEDVGGRPGLFVVGKLQDRFSIVEWWIDPVRVDLLFQRLCLLAGHVHFAVPATGGHRAGGPEIKARRVWGRGEGPLRHSEPVGGGVVAGELAQRY